MPWSKVKNGDSWAVVDQNGQQRATGLAEPEADDMVRRSYEATDRFVGRRPKGVAGPPDSLNVPFTYPNGG